MKPATILSCLLVCSVPLSGCGVLGGSSAACGQSPPSVKPSRAVPGDNFHLHGGGFHEGCNDTGLPFLREHPQRDIRVEMRQGERSWTLTSGLVAGGSPDYDLDVELKVPVDAKPGGAVVSIPDLNSAEPLEVLFRVLGDVPG